MVSTTQPGKGDQQMLTRPLVLVTLIAAFGSSFQYGYNAFVIFYPAKYIQNFYNETYRFRNVISIDHSLLKFQWGLTVAFFPFGGFCGTLIAGPLVDSIGRKATLLVNNLLAIIAAALVIATKPRRAHELLICSRFFVGICAGIAFSVVPLYLAEIAPQNLRGALCTVADLSITFGSLLAEAIGFREVLGTEEGKGERKHILNWGDSGLGGSVLCASSGMCALGSPSWLQRVVFS
uniref:Major facilitator superfamily (MFS) profile domain-containing protein n=1 Tax=Laticauda laticaudata TaxID=8630 RepID=A0A8C5RI83_LATLA